MKSLLSGLMVLYIFTVWHSCIPMYHAKKHYPKFNVKQWQADSIQMRKEFKMVLAKRGWKNGKN